MAVLEAFVYDPLLNWRLVKNEKESKKIKIKNDKSDLMQSINVEI